jgi:hypothetical protein
MKRAIAFLSLFASAAVGFAQQNKDPVTSVVKEILPHQEKNLVAAVEEMPADRFGYKPTPQQMSFAHLVLHMTESNNYLCAKAGDVPEPKAQELKETDGKDRIVHSEADSSGRPEWAVIHDPEGHNVLLRQS